MSIFGTKKKEEIILPKTYVNSDLVRSSNDNEFNEVNIQKQSKIIETGKTLSEPQIKNEIPNNEIGVLIDLGAPQLKQEKLDIKEAIIQSREKNELFQKIEEKTKLTETKTDNETKDKELSLIGTLAMSRPSAIAFDLGDDRFIDNGYEVVKFDIFGTDADLLKLINEKPYIRYLDISDCRNLTNFTPISRLTELKHLDLSGNKDLNNISFLSNLSNLTILNIGITGITSLDSLPYLPNLKVLNLKMNKIKSLNGIEKQTNLHDIILWGSEAESIDGFVNLKELRAVDFDNCGLLKDFSPLSNLCNLMFLNFANVKMSNLDFLRNLTNLQALVMDTAGGILSEVALSNFDNLTKMKFLCMKNMTLRNLSHFSNMKELTFLELSGNSIIDLKPLEDLVNINNLILSNNLGLTDLNPLHKMSKMVKLKLNGLSGVKNDKGWSKTSMSIEDFGFLKYMPNLEVLESDNNGKVRDISSVVYCQKLKEAHFNGCFTLADVTPLRFCKDLEELYFNDDTQIKDLSFLKYLTKLKILNTSLTNLDPLKLSNLTNLLTLGIWGLGSGSHPMYKPNAASSKFRKTMIGSLKKSIKA
ncbi:MAG TPA: leucine-rich repeat domain-containing protein [Rickettsiales bacterium]|nr:leucine-rich repeat domain-containing protein [Rickettsiales bacterium]